MARVAPPHPLVALLMAERFRRGWSRQHLAHVAGVSLRELAGMENGTITSPGVVVMERLGWALNLDLEWTHVNAA